MIRDECEMIEVNDLADVASAQIRLKDLMDLGRILKDDIKAIEQALVQQWLLYGTAPGGAWHPEPDVTWAEAPIPQLPYNAVIHTRLGSNAGERIDEIMAHFRGRDVQFMWLVHPTASPSDLVDLLLDRGLSHAEDVIGMSLDLSTWQPVLESPDARVVYKEVNNEQTRIEFEELLVAYWELPKESQYYSVGMSEWSMGKGEQGVRWIALLDGVPVGKIYLSLDDSHSYGAIFGVFVKPEARGHGIAMWLSQMAISRARDLGLQRVVLHSSAMAHGIYTKLGFVDRCTISIYGTTSLHSSQLI